MGATLLLYLTIFLGLYAQIVLGFFQVIVALVLLGFLGKLSKKLTKHLIVYWIIVLLYGLLYLLEVKIFNIMGDLWWFVIVVVPMSIAGYFTYVLESLKKNEL